MGDDKNHVGATVVGATLVVAPTTVALKVDRARDRNGMAAVMYPETLRATSLHHFQPGNRFNSSKSPAIR